MLNPRHFGTLSPRLPIQVRRCSFSSTRVVNGYDATLKNLKIGRHTRVVFQGFTGIHYMRIGLNIVRQTHCSAGRQATANAKESIEWGTNIVGGVTPGREGQHLGLPVLPTMRKVKPNSVLMVYPRSDGP
jgi:succinyl-CoA synthetase alpha subunit